MMFEVRIHRTRARNFRKIVVVGCVGADGSIRLYDDGVIEGDGADGIHLSVAMRTSNGRKTS